MQYDKNLYIITEDYDDISYHLSLDEAEAYLKDLRKANPSGEYYLLDKKIGRDKSHMISPQWSIEGVYDIMTGDMQQVLRNWHWPSLHGLPKLPENGAVISRYIPVYMANSENADDFERIVKKHFQKLKWVKIDDYLVRIGHG